MNTRRSFLRSLLGAIAFSPVVCKLVERASFDLGDALRREKKRDSSRAMINGLYDGLPPYGIEELKAEGIKWRCNYLFSMGPYLE